MATTTLYSLSILVTLNKLRGFYYRTLRIFRIVLTKSCFRPTEVMKVVAIMGEFLCVNTNKCVPLENNL